MRVTRVEERMNLERTEEELKESEGESDSDEDEESTVHLPNLPSYGSPYYGDSSDDPSLSSARYCCVCDCPGPKGRLCNADGCEDSNCIYE